MSKSAPQIGQTSFLDDINRILDIEASVAREVVVVWK
jgi:hypothetical protein